MTIRTLLVSLLASSSFAGGMSVALAQPNDRHGHGSFRFEPCRHRPYRIPGGVGTAPKEQPFLLRLGSCRP